MTCFWTGVQRPLIKKLVESIVARVGELGLLADVKNEGIHHEITGSARRDGDELFNERQVHSTVNTSKQCFSFLRFSFFEKRGTLGREPGRKGAEYVNRKQTMDPKRLKVAILYDIWEEDTPEPEPEPEPEKKKRVRKKGRKKKKVEKHDREEIFEALEKLGHEPIYQVVDGRKQSLISLARCGADLIFNLTESYAGDDTMDMNIAGSSWICSESLTPAPARTDCILRRTNPSPRRSSSSTGSALPISHTSTAARSTIRTTSSSL